MSWLNWYVNRCIYDVNRFIWGLAFVVANWYVKVKRRGERENTLCVLCVVYAVWCCILIQV